MVPHFRRHDQMKREKTTRALNEEREGGKKQSRLCVQRTGNDVVRGTMRVGSNACREQRTMYVHEADGSMGCECVWQGNRSGSDYGEFSTGRGSNSTVF